MQSTSIGQRARAHSFLVAVLTAGATAVPLGGCWIDSEASTATTASAHAPDGGDAASAKKKKKKEPSSDGGAHASLRDGGRPGPGGSVSDAGLDALGSAPRCTTPIGHGDLRIVEILVTSSAGAADRGEWIEIENARACTVDLDGVRVSSPRVASAEDSATIVGATFLPPGGRFIVASSTSPAINGGLPGLVVPIVGNGSDFLDAYQDLILVQAGATLVDMFAYDLIALSVGTPYAFPETCREQLRNNASSWKVSRHVWSPGRFGTPNAPNDDVICN